MLREIRKSGVKPLRNWFANTKTKTLDNLPFLIILLFTFETIFSKSEWYYRNHLLLDNIDTVMLFFCLLNAFIFKRVLRYSELNRLCGISILCVIFLHLTYYTIGIDYARYLGLYQSIIVGCWFGIFIIKCEQYFG